MLARPNSIVSRFIVNSCAVVVGVLAFQGLASQYNLAEVTGQSDLPVIDIMPRPFTVSRKGDYAFLDQGEFRRAYFKPSTMHSIIRYTPGKSSAHVHDHPVVLLHGAGSDFRLDCVDEEHADRIIKLLIEWDTEK